MSKIKEQVLELVGALQELNEGKGIPHNIVKEKAAKWLKK